MYPSTSSNGPSADTGYVPYFYESGLHQLYGKPRHNESQEPGDTSPTQFDFSSDLVASRQPNHPWTVEQIVQHGYLAIPKGDPAERLEFRVEGRRLDWLLFDWLNELLYVFESRRLVLSLFEVEVDEDGLSATARAYPFDPRRQRATHEVKAITYHRLRVERVDEGGWIAEVIVDI